MLNFSILVYRYDIDMHDQSYSSVYFSMNHPPYPFMPTLIPFLSQLVAFSHWMNECYLYLCILYIYANWRSSNLRDCFGLPLLLFLNVLFATMSRILYGMYYICLMKCSMRIPPLFVGCCNYYLFGELLMYSKYHIIPSFNFSFSMKIIQYSTLIFQIIISEAQSLLFQPVRLFCK